MKFDYVKISLHKESVTTERTNHLRPIIPIKIKAEGGGTLGYYALIDSGADFCIFHGEIGEAIGIDVRSGPIEKFGGIKSAKACIGYAHTVGLVVGGHEVPARVCFSYDINTASGYGIVGQHGFFDSWKIKFNLDKEIIELEPL